MSKLIGLLLFLVLASCNDKTVDLVDIRVEKRFLGSEVSLTQNNQDTCSEYFVFGAEDELNTFSAELFADENLSKTKRCDKENRVGICVTESQDRKLIYETSYYSPTHTEASALDDCEGNFETIQ